MADLINDKQWYSSRAVWGGLLALAGSVAGAFGYAVSPADVSNLTDLIIAVVTGAGGVLAIIGRLTATKMIQR